MYSQAEEVKQAIEERLKRLEVEGLPVVSITLSQLLYYFYCSTSTVVTQYKSFYHITYFLLPVQCNVRYPESIDSVSVSEDGSSLYPASSVWSIVSEASTALSSESSFFVSPASSDASLFSSLWAEELLLEDAQSSEPLIPDFLFSECQCSATEEVQNNEPLIPSYLFEESQCLLTEVDTQDEPLIPSYLFEESQHLLTEADTQDEPLIPSYLFEESQCLLTEVDTQDEPLIPSYLFEESQHLLTEADTQDERLIPSYLFEESQRLLTEADTQDEPLIPSYLFEESQHLLTEADTQDEPLIPSYLFEEPCCLSVTEETERETLIPKYFFRETPVFVQEHSKSSQIRELPDNSKLHLDMSASHEKPLTAVNDSDNTQTLTAPLCSQVVSEEPLTTSLSKQDDKTRIMLSSELAHMDQLQSSSSECTAKCGKLKDQNKTSECSYRLWKSHSTVDFSANSFTKLLATCSSDNGQTNDSKETTLEKCLTATERARKMSASQSRKRAQQVTITIGHEQPFTSILVANTEGSSATSQVNKLRFCMPNTNNTQKSDLGSSGMASSLLKTTPASLSTLFQHSAIRKCSRRTC